MPKSTKGNNKAKNKLLGWNQIKVGGGDDGAPYQRRGKQGIHGWLKEQGQREKKGIIKTKDKNPSSSR